MQRAFLPILLMLLFALQAFLRFQSDIIQDCAWFIDVAERLLDGKALYADIKEVNPPLGMWMIVPIVWLAKTLSISSVSITYTTLLGMSAGTLALCNRYLRLNGSFQSIPRHLLVIAIAVAILFFPAAFFAEREHFIILLFLPWIFLRALPATETNSPSYERLLVGALAAIAICIKPQSVFAPAFVELVLYIRNRKMNEILALENLGALAVSMIYAISVVIFAPLFITEMIGLGAKAYVPFYGYPSYIIALNARWSIIALLIAVVITIRLKTLKIDTTIITVMMAAATGFLLSYAVQWKGFTYQVMPASILMWLTCAAGAAMLWQTEKKLSVHILAAVAVGGLVLSDVPQTYVNSYRSVSTLLANNAPNAKTIFIASTRLDDGFPFVQKHNLIWASRLPTQWLTPYVASKWQSGSLPQDDIVYKAMDWTVSDLITMKPDIVMIDISNDQAYVPGGSFDYIKFWQNDLRFSEIWSRYEYREKARDLAVYTLRQK
jgi:hypothetical protein